MTDRLEEARERIEAQRKAKENVDPVVEFLKLSDDLPEDKRYPHRDEIPEALHQYSDWYTQKSGQQPDKKVLSDWLDTFWYWHSKGLDTATLDQAFENFDVVWRPGTLSNTAVALKAKARAVYHKPEIFRASDKEEKEYVPMPRDLYERTREKLRAKAAQDKADLLAHDPKPIGDVLKGMQNG